MSALLRSLLVRAETSNASAFRSFIEAAWAVQQRFADQRDNAYRPLRTLAAGADARTTLRAYVTSYAAYYKTDLPLWFVAVLTRGLRGQGLPAAAFGGPQPQTPQRTLVQKALREAEGTPLAAVIEDAYDFDLRNAAGHNDLVFAGREWAGLKVTDGKTGRSWSAAQVAVRLAAIQHVVGAVMEQLMWTRNLHLPKDTSGLAQRGVISATFYLEDTPENTPVVVLPQLWCFRDLDPTGTWLDGATCQVTADPASDDRVQIGDVHHSTGGAVTAGPTGRAILERGWVQVLRLPVTPHLASGHPSWQVGPRGAYEVVGPYDQHYAPIELSSPLACPPWPRSPTGAGGRP